MKSGIKNINLKTSYKDIKVHKAQHLSQRHEVHKVTKKRIFCPQRFTRARNILTTDFADCTEEQARHPELDSGSLCFHGNLNKPTD